MRYEACDENRDAEMQQCINNWPSHHDESLTSSCNQSPELESIAMSAHRLHAQAKEPCSSVAASRDDVAYEVDGASVAWCAASMTRGLCQGAGRGLSAFD